MASGANPNEPRSVANMMKQRQLTRGGRGGGGGGGGGGGRGSGRGGGAGRGAPGGPNVSDNLNPILPPLYPPAPTATQLKPDVVRTVQVYNKLAHYFRSNFSVQPAAVNTSGFFLDRYTDQYQSALALKPHLLQKLPDSRYPEDLTKKHVSKVAVARRMKRKIEDLPDTDEVEREGTAGKTVPNPAEVEEDDENDEEKEEKPDAEDLDDMEEDADEEMDQGTDYAISYFDTGEGDEEDRDDEDGATY